MAIKLPITTQDGFTKEYHKILGAYTSDVVSVINFESYKDKDMRELNKKTISINDVKIDGWINDVSKEELYRLVNIEYPDCINLLNSEDEIRDWMGDRYEVEE